MKEITLKVNDNYYFAFLHFVQTLNYVEIKEKETALEPQERIPKYNFLDIVGQLEWTGDAVAEQRQLRNEW